MIVIYQEGIIYNYGLINDQEVSVLSTPLPSSEALEDDVYSNKENIDINSGIVLRSWRLNLSSSDFSQIIDDPRDVSSNIMMDPIKDEEFSVISTALPSSEGLEDDLHFNENNISINSSSCNGILLSSWGLNSSSSDVSSNISSSLNNDDKIKHGGCRFFIHSQPKT